MYINYKVGDTAYIYAPGHKSGTTPYKVVHEFVLYGSKMYVLEYDTHIEPVYAVREAYSMSPSSNKRIGLWN